MISPPNHPETLERSCSQGLSSSQPLSPSLQEAQKKRVPYSLGTLDLAIDTFVSFSTIKTVHSASRTCMHGALAMECPSLILPSPFHFMSLSLNFKFILSKISFLSHFKKGQEKIRWYCEIMERTPHRCRTISQTNSGRDQSRGCKENQKLKLSI